MLNPDFRDMLSEFVSSEVEFLLVGAYALAAHGYPRSTGDIDLWVRADVETALKVYDAIARFGAPECLGSVFGVSAFSTGQAAKSGRRDVRQLMLADHELPYYSWIRRPA